MVTEGEKIRIMIGADVVPTNSSQNAFDNALMEELLGAELYARLLSTDIRIFNLEVPLTDQKEPIQKCGPSIIAPTSSINGIVKLNPSLITLANNHIMDQGSQGLISTISLLSQKGIPFCGAGLSGKDAQKPWVYSMNGITVGVYACTEHEFSIAEGDKPGANPVGAYHEIECIQQLKQKCNYVIVLYHGGKEYYQYPSPNLQQRCRTYIDNGADFVFCQHSHCIGCEERYQHGLILYGQGNFLYDRDINEFWDTSLLVELELSKTDYTVRYIPIEKHTPGARIAGQAKTEQILSDFFHRSKQIEEDTFVLEQYHNYAAEMLEGMIVRLDYFSSTFLFRAANKLSKGKLRKWYVRKFLLRRKGTTILNTVECEAWRELLITAIKTSFNE